MIYIFGDYFVDHATYIDQNLTIENLFSAIWVLYYLKGNIVHGMMVYKQILGNWHYYNWCLFHQN